MKKEFNILETTTIKNLNKQKLSKDDEIELIKLINKGKEKNASKKDLKISKDALDIFIYANQGLVGEEIKKHYPKCNYKEVFQYGIIGLTGAIQTYDYNKAKFSTHAVLWIKQAIDRGLATRENIIRIPMQEIQKINSIKKVINEFHMKNHVEPNIEQIHELLKEKFDLKEIKELLSISQTNIKSLDDDMFDDAKQADFIPDKKAVDPNDYAERNRKRNLFFKHFKTLPLIDQKIYSLSKGIYDDKIRNPHQISIELGISNDKVLRSLSETKKFLASKKISYE